MLQNLLPPKGVLLRELGWVGFAVGLIEEGYRLGWLVAVG
jgi:hypothetical protein